MILYLSIFFQNLVQAPALQLLQPQTRRASCPGPGTFVNGTGGCECAAETPFGDPESTTGCWNCDPPCDSNAQCIASDTCKCNEGYIGDGLDVCEKPVPVLFSYSPKNGPSEGGTVVLIKISVNASNYTADRAYCRFGPVIVDAIEVNSSYVKCLTHKNKPGNVTLSVGFDAVRWSSQSAEFTFINFGVSMFTVFFASLLALMGLIVLSLVAWYYLKKNSYTDQPEEMLPLNKWHMNAQHISPQSEKNWIDFLWNISFE